MMIKSENKKVIVTLTICIISLVLIITGSMAAFYYNHIGTENLTQINDLEIELLESDNNVINISNALPMTDKQGKAQEETFDFEVKTKTKRNQDIQYSLILEKIGTKCEELENPTKEDYPMCYKGILTDEVKALSIELFMNAFDMTEEQATAYYDAVIEHDKDEMTKLMIKAGIPREEAKQITAEIAAYGYENFLIMLYEENTGTETTLEYEFIENRYIGKLCKDITNPTEDTNPECYDYKNESTLISFLEEYMDLSNAQAVDFYKSVKSHDKERIFLFFLTILNASPGVSINIATEFEKNGYEEYIVLTYEQQTGNIFDKAKIYNETNVAQISYLKDNQVKIYLEDYQGNVILEPTLISEISYDYVLHKKVSTHSPENEEYKNKYKLRVWIDEETDSSDWNETTDLNYEFKIGVESRPPSYEVKYDANGGTSGLTTISEGAYAWTNENGVWKSNNTDEYGTESTLTTEEFTVEEEATLSFDWSVASNSDSDYLYYTLYKDDVPVEGTGVDTKISGMLHGPSDKALYPREEIMPSTLEKQKSSNIEKSFKEIIASAAPTEDELYYQTITHKLGPGKYVLEFKYIKEAIQPKESNTIYAYDKGYVKNIKLSDGMNNSVHVIGISSNLNSNIYIRPGYTFEGWSTTKDGEVEFTDKEKVLDLTKEINQTITLYAVWKPINYTIIYAANGGEGTMENSNHTFDISKPLNKNKFTKEGYHFLGWSTSENGSDQYYDEQEIKNLTTKNNKTVMLYAVWEANNYNIIYDANGGSGTMYTSWHNYDEELELNSNTFTKEGYIFIGWNTNKDAIEPLYTDQQLVKNLTNENEKTITLYAIWEVGVYYEVKYNANGGYKISDAEMTTQGTYPWTELDGIWKSGNYNIASSISTMSSEEFVLTQPGIISFKWAVSSESKSYDYLYYTIYKDGIAMSETGTSTKIGGNAISNEKYLSYSTITKELEPGTYYIEFSYRKDSTTNSGLDRGYVKDIMISNPEAEMENSKHAMKEYKTLSKNEYKKSHYIFKGWSTTENGQVNYVDGEKVKDLTSIEGNIVNLYAIWEAENYTVNAVVKNGTITGETSKIITYNENGTFSIEPLVNYGNPTISCTNSQIATLENGILTVKNVSKNTTCTVTYQENPKVSVVVHNGVLDDQASKYVEYLGTTIFNITASEPILETATVTCTNSQTGTYANNTLTVSNVTKNTTCTVTLATSVTTLYEDGTFIINEKVSDREANTLIHGTVINEYLAYSPTQSYTFNSATILWNAEKDNIIDVKIGENISPTSTRYWFFECPNMKTGDFTNLDTSNVTEMDNMFWEAGYNSETFNLIGLNNWDVSNVSSMQSMFYNSGYNATQWNIGDLSLWNTEKLSHLNSMFAEAGRNATTFDIGNLGNWQTNNFTYLRGMFYYAGYNATTWNIGDLSSWNVSNVKSIDSMFRSAAYKADKFDIGNLSNWDTSKVTDATYTFLNTGSNATEWYIGDLSNWNVANVTSMSSMFDGAGEKATIWDIGDLSNWNVSKVTKMGYMFADAGKNSLEWDIGDLSNWNTSNVTEMWSMFKCAGYNVKNFSLKGLDTWDISKVTNIQFMFYQVGYNSETVYIGDLSNWNTSNVTMMSNTFNQVGRNAQSVEIVGIENWDVANVTEMNNAFSYLGENATTLKIGDLSKWNTSQVTDMQQMFYHTGYKAAYTLDLSSWTVTNVTNHSSFNSGVTSKVIAPTWPS